MISLQWYKSYKNYYDFNDNKYGLLKNILDHT